MGRLTRDCCVTAVGDMSEENRPKAILIVGPTGSGKSPLGDYLEAGGFAGRKCIHFDFGANLRRVAKEGASSVPLTERDMTVIVRALKAGALLENENFHIAKKILEAFVENRRIGPDDIMVLNGLPRHLGQALDIDRVVNIRLVIHLDCAPGALSERIRRNMGGDRTGREDDSPSAVACRLRVFQERTVPLLDHYQRRNAAIVRVRVKAETKPEDVMAELARGGYTAAFETPGRKEV